MEPARSWTLVVRGDSMRALLKAGDVIRVKRAPLSDLRAGDLAILLDWRGGAPDYVVHRLLGRIRRKGALYAVTKGDANFLPDPLSPESAVVGVVDAVRCAGVWRSLGSAGRAGGLAFAALGTPIYRALVAANALCEAVLRAARIGLSPSRPGRSALMALHSWRDRAFIGAFRSLHSLCVRLTLGDEVSAPPKSDAPRLAIGKIDHDQTWAGRVRVEGDVVVPRGVTLRIESGTEVAFRAESQWDCARAYNLGAGWPAEVEGKCRLLIKGRLIIEGTPEAPVTFGGENWGGIYFVADSWGSTISNIVISETVCAAVTLTESAQLSLLSSRLTDCASGVAVLGRDARAALEDCRIERCRHRGLSITNGALSARGVVISDCGEVGVFAEQAELELEDCTLSGSPVGLGQNGGSSRLTRLTVSGAAKAAFELDGGVYELRGASATGSGEAIRMGSGSLTIENFEAEGCGSGVSQRAGKLSWLGGKISGGRFGLESVGQSARIERVVFQNQAIAACRVTGGALSARGVVISDGGEFGVFAEQAELELEDCALSGSPVGLGQNGGSSRLTRLTVSGAAKAAFELDGGVYELRGASATGSGEAIRLGSGSLTIENFEAEGCGSGVSQRAGKLSWLGGKISGGRFGLESAGQSARIERVVFQNQAIEACRVTGLNARIDLRRAVIDGGLSIGLGAEGKLDDIIVKGSPGHGVQVAGGRLAARGCHFEDVSEAGVYVSDGGVVELKDCSFRRLRYGVGVANGDARLDDVRITGATEVGFSALFGRHRLARVAFHGCVDRIHAMDGAFVELVEDIPDGQRATAAFKRLLREIVIHTRRWPIIGAAYRAIYALPVRALQLWAACDGNMAALYAHRSWARRDWDPGLSDVDLIVVARDLSGSAGQRWIGRFWFGFLGLKSGFPFLSECLVAEPTELEGYARWGGFRSRGFADQLVSLNGALPRTHERPASPKAALEPLGEFVHAYTRLMSSALWRNESTQAGRSAVRNAALDGLRLITASADDGPAELRPREAALMASSSLGEALRGPLAALTSGESPRARAEICAESLIRLHEGASRLLSAWSAPGESSLRFVPAVAESSPADDVELRRRRGLAEEYARACGGSLIAGCADDLYRTYLVLDDAAAASPPTLIAAIEGLSRLVSLRGEPATLPIVLTASAWKSWSRLAYLESPTRFLEPGDGAGDVLIRAGAPLPGAWQYAWGREHLTPLPTADALILDLARESMATLRCVWRYQASEASPLSNGYIQHYLLGRTMGLRLLLERGVVSSFFALEPLRALYAAEFPERASKLECLWARLTERDGPAPWTELYSWADDELRR